MRKGLLALVLALAVLGLAACTGATAPTSNDIVFTASPATIAPGGTTTFHMTSKVASGCYITPSVGAVPCLGSKDWSIAAAGVYTFALYVPGLDPQNVTVIVR